VPPHEALNAGADCRAQGRCPRDVEALFTLDQPVAGLRSRQTIGHQRAQTASGKQRRASLQCTVWQRYGICTGRWSSSRSRYRSVGETPPGRTAGAGFWCAVRRTAGGMAVVTNPAAQRAARVSKVTNGELAAPQESTNEPSANPWAFLYATRSPPICDAGHSDESVCLA